MFEKLFELAKKKNIESLEIYVYDKEEIEISLFHGEIDTYNVSSLKTISARGIYKGQMGYASSEKFGAGMEKHLVDSIIKNAFIISAKEESVIYPGDEFYAEIHNDGDDLSKIPMSDKIAKLKELEKRCKELDSRITEVGGCEYNEVNTTSTIINSLGLNLSRKNGYFVAYVSPIARQENGDARDGRAIAISNHYKDFDVEKLAKNAVTDALSKIGAAPIESGKYKVVLQNKMMANLLGVIIGSTFAERVQKGQSMFATKLNQPVANALVSVVEDPLLKGGLESTSFDDEGVATYKKNIIEKGVLKTFLYNLKTAKKAGVKSTGNGYKPGATAAVGTGYVNAYLEPGETSFEDMLKQVGNGLLITELQGMHSGLDSISGNFSLQAKGFVIRNGEKAEPVSLITVAGNLFSMLNEIECVGNDLDYNFNPSIKAPSVIVKELVVAGK